MNIARTLAKNTVFGAVETGVDLFTAFLLGIVIARSLGANQFGVYAYITWLLGFGTLLADFGLGEMAKRYIAEAMGRGNHEEAVQVIRLSLLLRTAVSVIVGGGMIIFALYWPSTSGSTISRTYYILAALTVLPQGLHYIVLSIFRGFQKYEYAAYTTMVSAPARVILISILLVFGAGLREVLLVQVATFILGMVIGLYFLGRITPLKELIQLTRIEKGLRQKTVRYSLTLAGIVLVNYLASNQLSTFFIDRYCPIDQVGFFRLATRMVSMPAALLPTAFSFVLTPAIAEQFGKGDMGKIKTVYTASTRYLMMAAIPLEVGLIALAAPTIKLLYGMQYAPAITIMQILLVPTAIVSISNAAAAVIYGTNRPSSIFKINLLFAVYSVVMSMWLIPRYGVIGAAVINAIPLSSILIIIFANKRIQTQWPVADTIKITLASLIMGAAVFFLQSHVNLVLGLALGVTLGIAIYIALIFVFGAIHEQDIAVLRNIQASLPMRLRRPYIRFTGLVEKIMIRTRLTSIYKQSNVQ